MNFVPTLESFIFFHLVFSVDRVPYASLFWRNWTEVLVYDALLKYAVREAVTTLKFSWNLLHLQTGTGEESFLFAVKNILI